MLSYGQDNYRTVDGNGKRKRVYSPRTIHFLYVYYSDVDEYYAWPDEELTVEIPASWEPTPCVS